MIIGLSWKIFIYYLYNWKLKVWVVWLVRVGPRPINVRGHLKSEIYLLFESPYKIFNWHYLAISFRLRYIFFYFETLHVWPWRLRFRCQNNFYQLKLRLTFSLYILHFLDSISLQTFSRVWPQLLTVGGNTRSDIFLSFEIPYIIHDFLYTFYWHFLSISYRFWDIWINKSRVWLWPLTCRGHLRSNIFLPFESLLPI